MVISGIANISIFEQIFVGKEYDTVVYAIAIKYANDFITNSGIKDNVIFLFFIFFKKRAKLF